MNDLSKFSDAELLRELLRRAEYRALPKKTPVREEGYNFAPAHLASQEKGLSFPSDLITRSYGELRVEEK